MRTIVFLCAATAATTASADSTSFECLNHTSIQVVSCSGTIALFPITITIEHLHVLSNNEIDILSHTLNEVSVLDGDVGNYNTILDDVEAAIVDDVGDAIDVSLTDDDVSVCTSVLGALVCR